MIENKLEDCFSDSYSADICFCDSDCKNTLYSRNKEGEVFKRANKYRYATSNFSYRCASYKK